MSFPSFDALENFVATTVATAPSPATTGTSLVVASGTGAAFPTPPFNAVTWPSGVQPTATNAEIVRVTNIVTDTLTIVRGPQTGNDSGGATGASIAVGWNIARCVDAKDILDTQQAIPQGDFMASALTTSSTSASSADTTLGFNIGANQSFMFMALLQGSSSVTSTTGTMVGVTGPTGSTVRYSAIGVVRPGAPGATGAVVEGVALAAGTYIGPFNASTSTGAIKVWGTIAAQTTSGAMDLRFAASAAGVTVTVVAGSLIAFRVA